MNKGKNENGNDKEGKDAWDRVAKYFDTLTDVTAEAFKDAADEWAGMWNADDKKSTSDSAFDAMREVVGVGFRASAKAWVATRDLMTDLAD